MQTQAPTRPDAQAESPRSRPPGAEDVQGDVAREAGAQPGLPKGQAGPRRSPVKPAARGGPDPDRRGPEQRSTWGAAAAG